MLEPSLTNAVDPLRLVGTALGGKYDVERLVAETEFSLVYRATHRVWRRPVALKAFKAFGLSEVARQQLLESFVAEGALLMDLSERCAAICQARDVASVITSSGDWIPYMVLEWLEGEPLDMMLMRERSAGVHPRSSSAARRLLDPIAQALALAHERGIVHRDVKPGNVFVLADAGIDGACCKLLDFGIAKVASIGSGPSREGLGPQSFTPAYAAPEQFSNGPGSESEGGGASPATDVFALALVYVELVTGVPPLRGKTVLELASAARDPRLRPTPRALGAPVGDAIERVLARALAIRPEERYANAREFWSALGEAIAADHDATPPASAAERAPESADGRVSLLAPSTADRRARGRMPRQRPILGVAPPSAGPLPRSHRLRSRWVFPTLAVLAAVGAGLVALQHLAVWPAPTRDGSWSSAAPAAVVQLHSEPPPSLRSRGPAGAVSAASPP